MLQKFKYGIRKKITNVMKMNKKKTQTQEEIKEDASVFKIW